MDEFLRLIAARRGDEFADEISRYTSLPWPDESQALRAMARLRLSDLTRDEELLERLVEVMLRQARRRHAARQSAVARP